MMAGKATSGEEVRSGSRVADDKGRKAKDKKRKARGERKT